MSTLLSCPQGHKWWEPFTDCATGAHATTSSCPRCGHKLTLTPGAPSMPSATQPESISPVLRPCVSLNVELTIMGTPVKASIPVPTDPVSPRELLPLFRDLAETIVDIGVKAVESQGKKVSCRAGCGACCRQLVPIVEDEARQLHAVIDRLPEPRRSEVRARFAEARLRLEEAGLLDALQHPERFADDELRPVGLRYFHLGIPCPFLNEESCSIYPERPIACREYLVTSCATHCAEPTPETVDCVPLAAKVSTALTRLQLEPESRFVRWVPLVLAPEWAATHPEEKPPRPGPAVMEEFFQRLLERKREPGKSTASDSDHERHATS